MKFEIDRLAMLDAAKNAAKVAPSRELIDVLNGILVEGSNDTSEVFMTATNHEVSIQQKVIASVDESGSMLVNARLLVGMLSLLPGEFVTFSAIRPNVLTVMSGKCVYEINCLPAKHYPKPVMPFPEETVNLSGICSLAKRTVFAVSKDDSKPALQCVSIKLHLNTVHAAACDGIKMMLIKDTAGPFDEREFLLPGRSLQMLSSISSDEDVFEVSDVGNEAVFIRRDMMFTMRKLPGEYIDTTAILKGVVPVYNAVTDSRQMKEALDLIIVGAESKESVNLILSSGEIIMRRNGDYSEAQTMIPANVTKVTPDEGFYYNPGILAKLFQVLDGKVKLEIDAKGFMLVKTRSEVYLQLPMRIPVKKAEPAKKKYSVKSTNNVKEAA